ncbi:MAG: hypothetical protein QF731_01270 [Verrucomicrobiota bacterium]|jgi:hypothetical protein|nr:hypothetical protein [Verrucomicrobiota bacterium]MEE2614430.1 hypothetical protein [Verrucomicrobiota bacterium]
MKAIIAVMIGLMGHMLLYAENAASKSKEAVTLAKRDLVELEFDTTVGLGYQVYVKQGEADWEPHGQVVEGNGEAVSIIYTGDESGVEFRVDIVDLVKSDPAKLPEGIEYKLTGIYRLRGSYKVCVAKVDNRNQVPRTAYFTLGEGERAGTIKVMRIDSEKGLTEIEAHGVALSLSFSGNAYTTNTSVPLVAPTIPQVPAGRPTVVEGPPKGKVFMGNNDPYYKEAQKKAYTNRYSILDKSSVRSINRHVRSKPQSIFTPRISSQSHLPQIYILPKARAQTYRAPRR